MQNKLAAVFLIFLFAVSAVMLFGWPRLLTEYAVIPEGAREERARDVTLIFAGDIMLSRSIGRIMQKRNDWQYPFSLIATTTRAADIAIGNLEGPISDRGENQGSIYSFRADPRAVEGLSHAGFDVLSLANNHIMDYGASALLQTMEILRGRGIAFAGAGDNFLEAHAGARVTVRGTRFAFLSYTPFISEYASNRESRPAVAVSELETIKGDILRARTQSDVVIVLVHWGDEYSTKSNAEQRDLAYAAIDAGASAVIGHHPHVVQEVETYRNGIIAYSLGNFVFDQNFSSDTSEGLMLELSFRDGKVHSQRALPVRFDAEFRPYLAS